MIRNWRALKTIVKREYFAYFRSSLAYMFLMAYLVCSMIFTFRIARWYDLGEVNLRAFFEFHPYLFLFFVPAVGMRMWSEEEREGTLELLLTLPVRTWHAVMGKFFAAWLFIATSMLFTLPLIVSLFMLGTPDVGALVSGYVCTLLLAGMFLSLCGLCSAFTSTQVTSYISGFLLLLFFSVAGMAPLGVQPFLERYLPADKVQSLVFLSVPARVESLFRGVLDLRDVIYFASFIAFGLVMTALIIRSRSSSHSGNWPMTMASLCIVLLGTFFINLTFRSAVVRADLTEDKLYTLSDASSRLLKKLPGRVNVTFYFSNSSPGATIQHKAFARRVRDMLKEYSELSGGELSFVELDPRPGSPEERSARIDNIKPVVGLPGREVYFGLAVRYQKDVVTLPALTSEIDHELEFQLSRLVRNVTTSRRPLVAIYTTLPMLGQQADPRKGRLPTAEWELVTELRNEYDLRELPANVRELDPKQIDLVVLAHPGEMSDQMLFALDQYLLKGGKVLAFLDAWSSQAVRFRTGQGGSDIRRLSVAWRVLFHKNSVLADAGLQLRTGAKRNPFVLELKGDSIGREWAPLKGIKNLRVAYTGTIDYNASPDLPLKYQVLLSSSEKNALITGNQLNFPDKVLEKIEGSDEKSPKRILGLRITGKFRSTYADLNPGFAVSGKLKDGVEEGEVVMFADTDMMHKTLFKRLKNDPLTGGKEMQTIAENKAFILNMLDHMTYGGDLNELRQRRRSLRDFEYLDELRDEHYAQYGKQYQQLAEQSQKAQKSIAVLEDKIRRQIPLNPQEMQTLESQRELLSQSGSEVKALNGKLSMKMEEVKAFYYRLNLLLPPFLVLLLLVLRTAFNKIRNKRRAVA